MTHPSQTSIFDLLAAPPASAPYQRHSATSRAAAESIAPVERNLKALGATFDIARDAERTDRLLDKVRMALRDAGGAWLTYEEIAVRQGICLSQCASISARIRELRALGYPVSEGRLRAGMTGLWEFRWVKGGVQ